MRDQMGLSQERFALSIGMDRSYYASIETGARNVTLLNMAKIAGGFRVNLSELLKGVGNEEPPSKGVVWQAAPGTPQFRTCSHHRRT